MEPAAPSEASFVTQQARNGSQRRPFAQVAARTRRTLRNQEGYRRHAYDRNWADSSRDADRKFGACGSADLDDNIALIQRDVFSDREVLG
jgi:hypothetical protein